jgi:thiol-disulfide isomerase/thioredoxin
LLIRDVVKQYEGKARFVSENWGDSRLAEQFGVKRYPVVFVNDIMIARPDDFGWSGSKGRYKPWRDPANQERFKKDLARMIDLVLSDQMELAKNYQVQPDSENEVTSLPKFNATTIQAGKVESAKLAGKIVVVEFWATWCPPCRTTLNWLGELKRRYKDRLEIIAIAVESKEDEVRKLMAQMNLPVQTVMASDELLKQFGDPNSLPTLYVFDREGKVASAFYGAPKDLHQKVDKVFASILK